MLGSSSGPLTSDYDLLMFDLDGVIYVGGEAIAGVAERIVRARESGRHVAFVTNNASRTPEKVAAHLVELGVQAEAADVVTSAQAASRLLAERFPGGVIWNLGGAGLTHALEAEGLTVVTSIEDEPVALVSGYGPDLRWRDVMRAAAAIRDGLPWVASNTDWSFPTTYGLAPGHGVLVRTLAEFSGVEPVVAGKPARPLLDETIRRVGGERPLMVGDRLDTDIEGAHNAGIDSLLVLTGVSGLADLVAVTKELRPTYIAADLEGLFVAHATPTIDGDAFTLGGWRAQVDDGRLVVSGEGEAGDWWRVVATAGWTHLDAAGEPVDTNGVTPGGSLGA